MPSVLAALTAQQYRELRKLLCPYCAVALPDTKSAGDAPVWKHNIPSTSSVFECQAQRIRAIRNEDGAVDA